MNWLLERGFGIEDRDDQDVTPLLSAAKRGSRDAVGWLLDHGADIRATDRRGKTALQWAEDNRHAAVAELLRQHGAG